jgi:sugar lactone lactonase YvrE
MVTILNNFYYFLNILKVITGGNDMKALLAIIMLLFLLSCNSCGSDGGTSVVTIADVGGSPDGVTVADSGNIYITDIVSGDIKQISEDGTITLIETLSGKHPDGIAAVTAGSTDILYVADTGGSLGSTNIDGTIVKIEVSSDGSVTTTTGFVDTAVINTPTGIAVDNSGNLYVADQESGDVFKIPVTGGTAGTPVSLTDGTGISINEPHGLTLVTNDDNSITLYTTDQGAGSNNIIQIDISSGGSVTASELTNDNTGGTDTGTVSNAKFNEPHGITTDKNGAIFVCDENNNRVQIITPSGNVITFAGTGTSGDSDGDAGSAQFSKPRGLAADSNGDLLVCDYGNGKVKKILK